MHNFCHEYEWNVNNTAIIKMMMMIMRVVAVSTGISHILVGAVVINGCGTMSTQKSKTRMHTAYSRLLGGTVAPSFDTKQDGVRFQPSVASRSIPITSFNYRTVLPTVPTLTHIP